MKNLIALSLVLGAFVGMSQSCSTTNTGAKLEAMSAEDFDSLSLRVELVTRALLGRLVDDGKVTPERVLNVADAIDAILEDQSIVLLGTGLVSAKLKQQGWKDDEIMLAVMLVEDLVRSWAHLPREGLPLGPHGRALRPPCDHQWFWCVPHGAAVNHAPEEFGTCESGAYRRDRIWRIRRVVVPPDRLSRALRTGVPPRTI